MDLKAKVIYTEYAEETIIEREINKKTIENALFNPEEIVEAKKGRKIAHKLVNGKLLRVVYESMEKAYKL